MIKLLALATAAPLLLATPSVAQDRAATGAAGLERPSNKGLPIVGAYAELKAATAVIVVRFSTMPNANSRTEAVFGDGEDPDLVSLRMMVANSKSAVAVLEAEGFTAQHVVAMKATHDGAVYLYVNDLS